MREEEKNESTPGLTWMFVYVYDLMVDTRIQVGRYVSEEGATQP